MAKREEPRKDGLTQRRSQVASRSGRIEPAAARQTSEMPRLKTMRAEFRRAHMDGMAALREGDYGKVGEAIDREQHLIAEQRALIEEQRSELEGLIRRVAHTLKGASNPTAGSSGKPDD